MGKRLARRRAADEDVAAQLAYFAAIEPPVAHRYAMALQHAYGRLCDMPEIGFARVYPGRTLRVVRVWPVPGFRRFLIFYRVTPTTVEIIRVLHSARNRSKRI